MIWTLLTGSTGSTDHFGEVHYFLMTGTTDIHPIIQDFMEVTDGVLAGDGIPGIMEVGATHTATTDTIRLSISDLVDIGVEVMVATIGDISTDITMAIMEQAVVSTAITRLPEEGQPI